MKRKSKSAGNRLQGKLLLSIDIGQHTSKLVLGRKTKTEIEVRRAIAFETPRKSVENGRILNMDLLAEKISSLIRTEKLNAKYGLCTVENNQMVVREISLPTADEEDMKSMLQFEVQHSMPIELSKYIVQSKILGTSEESGTRKTHFICTAVPKSLVYSYYELLQKTGLRAVVMDTQSNSIGKLFELETTSGLGSTIPTEKSVAVIDFGYSKINVIMLNNGKYKFNRLIHDGGAGIDRSLAGFFNYTEEEIERRKAYDIDLSQSSALVSDYTESDDILWRETNAVKRVVDNWIIDIKRLFTYYNNINHNKIEKVMVYGGTANMKGFIPYFSEALQLHVELIKELNRIDFMDGAESGLTPFINPIGALLRR